ncbi:hypothetical protein [Clostridium sp. BJN0001]|uniref:hypothetical protein n=1 Tax=Clostridium sp. BJN0001 TaxID=2930219 RepID=UPI001FD42EE2|nr:hypothetical protein [Clostridium sp. BJN0001]
MKRIILNFYCKIKYYLRIYNYILLPILILGIYLYTLYFKKWVNIDNDFAGKLISVCSVFIGFLVTSNTIIISFPEDKTFVKYLKKYKYYKKLFIEIIISEISFTACLIISLFSINNNLASILFVIGTTYLILMAELLITISFYISK